MSAAKKTAEPAPASPAPRKSNGLAIAALIVGIVAILSGWVPFWGFVVGAAAIILGIIALKKAGQKGMSIAGIITGAVGVLWSLIVTILFILAIVTLSVGGAVVGGAVVGDALSQELASQQAKADAKKDFAKGETATFGDFEVKVTKVTTDFQVTDRSPAPGEGNQYIVVELSVKNIDSIPQHISKLNFSLAVQGVVKNASFIEATPVFEGGKVLAGETITGNIVYEVPLSASDLKLTYSTYGYEKGEFKSLTYTLAI